MEKVFARRVEDLKASAIREIFKIIGQADIISFAGGIPDPNLYPSDELGKISQQILKENPKVALQYGVTEGYMPLRDIVRERMAKINSLKDSDDIIITTGAQQAIDLAIKVLVDDDQKVAVENPSFVGTLNSFRSYNAKLFGVDVQDDGMNLDALEQLMKKEDIKLIYTIPTFQNPCGTTMSLEKRKRLLELAKKYNAFILEDNPYGELRFKGENVPTIKSMDDEGRVIYVGSFSKILSPGMRLGWVSARKDILDRIVVVKQVNDVHTPMLTQMMATRYIQEYDMEAHIKNACKLYGEKCQLMIDCIEKYFPEGCTHTNPQGGIFILCTLPEGTDSKKLLEKSIQRKVAFVPGNTFVIDMDPPSNMIRLNFSTASEQEIVKGIEILGNLLHEEL